MKSMCTGDVFIEETPCCGICQNVGVFDAFGIVSLLDVPSFRVDPALEVGVGRRVYGQCEVVASQFELDLQGFHFMVVFVDQTGSMRAVGHHFEASAGVGVRGHVLRSV